MMTTGEAHILNCTTNFSIMKFDSSCDRCGIIKKVVFLRRKSVENGASPEEESRALELADSLREKYGLRRGEIFDRQYEAPPTKVEYRPPPPPPPRPRDAAWDAFKSSTPPIAPRPRPRMRPVNKASTYRTSVKTRVKPRANEIEEFG